MKNDAKGGKQCKGAENNARVRKTMQRHRNQCKSKENNAKVENSAKAGCENQNKGQVACMGVATGMRSNKTRKTASEAKSAF